MELYFCSVQAAQHNYDAMASERVSGLVPPGTVREVRIHHAFGITRILPGNVKRFVHFFFDGFWVFVSRLRSGLHLMKIKTSED